LLASKSIIQEKKNFKVLLVGNGPFTYTKRLKLLTKELGIENNVLIHKAVHREVLPSFFNAADIAVWPGSFSISIIEAMACNLPIAIAKSDWTSHYLEYENGYSFKAGDINGLRSILLKLVNNPELRKTMGTRSRKLVEDKLNWNVIAMAYINAYRN
jgi:phosphatidylinositol alpha-1,6-mannosyltransferase